MAIINPLPYTIANGDPVDATPVEANFAQIVSNVNAGAAPVAGNASQEFLVATTANPAGAVPLLQAQQQFAALAGNSSQAFAVASGTGADAVPYSLLTSYAAPVSGSTSQAFSVGAAASGSAQAPQADQVIGQLKTSLAYPARALSTIYTNSGTSPLFVSAVVSFDYTAAGESWTGNLFVAGASAARFIEYNESYTGSGLTNVRTLIGIVPPGQTYEVTLTNTGGTGGKGIQFWVEY